MEVKDALELVTSKEFLGVVAAAGSSLAGVVVKVRREMARREERIVSSLAGVIVGSTRATVRDSLISYEHARLEQIGIAEKRLSEYATVVTMTAGDMARSIVTENESGVVEEIAELWACSVQLTITHVCLSDIIRVLSKTELSSLNDRDLHELIDDLTEEVFHSFLTSMRGYFRKEKIRLRIKFIEDTLDRGFMRQTIAAIIYECMSISVSYHSGEGTRDAELSGRVQRDILATTKERIK